jgi:glycosyltransferase involved in cell wall biosynthesis
MIKPLFSVIMPCYKMGRFVGEALASVGAQTYRDWEVIVVDDCGPDDGTKEAVDTFAQKFPKHRVELFRHERNRGVSAARNTAIQAARGGWLAFLDPDDVWLPEKLSKQAAVFEADRNIVTVYTQALISRSGEGSNYNPGVELTGNAPRSEPAEAVIAIASGEIMFAFSSLVLKREICEMTGGFQENLAFQNEDRLLIGSCALFGQLAWVPEPLCVYRMHDGSATTSVIRKEIASLVEFDLAARLALGLRRQPQGKVIGAQIVKDILRLRLKQTLEIPSWFRFRFVVIDLCAQLALAYPSASIFFARQFLRHSPVWALVRRIARHLFNQVIAPRTGDAS